MSGEQMKTIGYDITDEIDGNADNGNFHGEFVSLANRIPLPPEDPKEWQRCSGVRLTSFPSMLGYNLFS